MRDYKHIDAYLNLLQADIYTQPPDAGHSSWALNAINDFADFFDRGTTVLDVGCGSGFCAGIFHALGLKWSGVTLGADANAAKMRGADVHRADMSFLPFDEDTYDIIFARHVLEHSPMPLLTLMEWARVGRKYLLLVAPAPEHWGYAARNHYAVMNREQIGWLAKRAGWHQISEQTMANHAKEYLDTLPNDKERQNARNIRPPLEVEYRFLFKRQKVHHA